MIYVENAAAAHLLAADALARVGPAGRAYYISQGEPVNCWQWIERDAGLGRRCRRCAESIGFRAAWRVGRRGRSDLSALLRHAGRAADDAVSGQPVGPVSLLQHRRRTPRFRLSARRFPPPKECAAWPTRGDSGADAGNFDGIPWLSRSATRGQLAYKPLSAELNRSLACRKRLATGSLNGFISKRLTPAAWPGPAEAYAGSGSIADARGLAHAPCRKVAT